jgi:hypothetical protein
LVGPKWRIILGKLKRKLVHLVFARASRTGGLNLYLLALDLRLVQMLHSFFCITHVVELDELVVLLVRGLSYLLNLSILSEGRLQLLVGR